MRVGLRGMWFSVLYQAAWLAVWCRGNQSAVQINCQDTLFCSVRAFIAIEGTTATSLPVLRALKFESVQKSSG